MRGLRVKSPTHSKESNVLNVPRTPDSITRYHDCLAAIRSRLLEHAPHLRQLRVTAARANRDWGLAAIARGERALAKAVAKGEFPQSDLDELLEAGPALREFVLQRYNQALELGNPLL